MEIETQVRLQQTGLAIAQGSLLLACALVALPAVLLTELAIVLGGASEATRKTREEKEDGNCINKTNARSILMSVVDIAWRSIIGKPLVEIEADTPNSDETGNGPYEETVKIKVDDVTHDDLNIVEQVDSNLPDEDSEASKS